MHTFKVSGVSSELRVMRFEGFEALSQLYRFDVTVACEDPAIAFTDVVGKNATLTFQVDDEPRHVHGIVSRFEQGEEGKKLTSYRATVVPLAWRLQHRRDSRIFQAKTVPDILKEVFSGAGLDDLKVSLSGSYSAREYCVQYRESDWDFACRLMEEEGIYYFFEHSEDADTLVLADAPSAHNPISGESTLSFRPPLGAMVKGEHVSRFRYAEEVRPGKVTLRDYNFKKPSLSLEASTSGSDDTDLEIYDYPGEYEDPGGGSGLAKVRLEELGSVRKIAEGESACPRFVPGSLFTLSEHGRDDLNRSYLIVRVEHHGSEPHMEASAGAGTSPYGNRFEVIPDDVPFRPRRVTPRPTIKGIQTAIVVGPGGEEIYTDEHGRVKVQFHWDRQGKKDDKSSCWIRVGQVWAGPAWGALYIPRIGHEVVVDFIEGDPDRPLIVGSVYHGANVPPYPLPGEKTKSTIKSNSSMGGGGFNEIRFEDKKGMEEIYIHGQKDWTIDILNDKKQTIGHDETLEVGHDRRKTVKNDQSETIGNNKKIKVGNNHTEIIGGSENIAVAVASDKVVGAASNEVVGAAKTVKVGGVMSQVVGGNMSVTVGGDQTASVSGKDTVNVGGDEAISIGGKYSLEVTGDSKTNVQGNDEESITGEKSVTVGKTYVLQCGEGKLTIKKDGTIMIEGKDITIEGKGTIKVQGAKLEVKSDGTVDVNASGAIKIKGSAVDVN
ncbi:MAG: type VI secretion system tip protein TssI/VgrG [Byssovorax sp.]